MTNSIESKRRRIEQEIKLSPGEGHPHYWCGGTETDCEDCNMDHSSTEVYLEMLDEEQALLMEETRE
jgi:hypothetical protein